MPQHPKNIWAKTSEKKSKENLGPFWAVSIKYVLKNKEKCLEFSIGPFPLTPPCHSLGGFPVTALVGGFNVKLGGLKIDATHLSSCWQF